MGPLCVLHWQFDGTPQKVVLEEASSIDALGGAGDQEAFKKQGKDGTRDVLVQKGVFITPEIVEDIFAKPRILGDQTSVTNLDAVMEEMAALGVDIHELSKSFHEALLHFAVDGAATCELVVDYIKCLVQPLGWTRQVA